MFLYFCTLDREERARTRAVLISPDRVALRQPTLAATAKSLLGFCTVESNKQLR